MDWRHNLFKGHLEEGEQILTVVHKHWLAIFTGVVRIVLISFLFPYLLYFLFPLSFFLGVMLIWMCIGLLQIAYLFFNWYLDAWLLTNTGILDVRWDGFFKRSAQRIDYKSIEQVGYAFNGILQTLFSYGTLQIQQAGGVEEIKNVENPKKVSSLITHYQEQFLSAQKYEDEEGLKDILTGMIKRHIDRHGLSVDIEKK